jgi:hypothetical protein
VQLDPADVRNPGQYQDFNFNPGQDFEQGHEQEDARAGSGFTPNFGPCPSDPKKPKPQGCGGKTCPGGNQGSCPAGVLCHQLNQSSCQLTNLLLFPERERCQVGPEVAPTPAFYGCIPQEYVG